jgi:hypothetical protein
MRFPELALAYAIHDPRLQTSPDDAVTDFAWRTAAPGAMLKVVLLTAELAFVSDHGAMACLSEVGYNVMVPVWDVSEEGFA